MKKLILMISLSSCALFALPGLAEEPEAETTATETEDAAAQAPEEAVKAEPQFTAQSLGDVQNLFIQIDSSADLGQCPGGLRSGLRQKGITVVTDKASADSLLKIKMVPVQRSLRSELDWIAVLEGADQKQLYSDDGGESGWSHEGACKDALEDLAEDMGDSIQRAKRLKF